MLTYLSMNMIFLAAVLLFLWRVKQFKFSKLMMIVLAVLLVCTAIFDSLIILADIVRYDPELIMGIKVWAAPVEDFFYSLVAALLIPSIWNLSEQKREEADHESVKAAI